MALTQPITQSIGYRRLRLVEPYEYQYKSNGVQHRIIVPKDFEFDGSSIPQLFWTILGQHPEGLMEGPSVIHDLMDKYDGLVSSYVSYYTGEKWVRYNKRWSWKEAALLFRTMMKEAGIKRWRANVAYLAVRLAGLWRRW